MPLIPYADIEKLPDDVREAFDRLPRKLNIFRMCANADTLYRPAMRLGGAILGRQQLGASLRELVILLVARIEGGTYEWVQHVPIAETAGCRKEQIDAIEKSDIAAACFDAREKALLAFAADVIRNVAASEDKVKAASEHFSPKEIVEIILTCGFYMMMARLTETTRVDVDGPGGTAVLESLTKMR
jgi:alkylhydroperoxidase family enzyme